MTLAVEAGRAAIGETDGSVTGNGAAGGVQRVVLVSRDLPLLEGGNAAVLLAGLASMLRSRYPNGSVVPPLSWTR